MIFFFFDIFAIHSSSRHEKCFQMSVRLFSVLQGSRNEQCCTCDYCDCMTIDVEVDVSIIRLTVKEQRRNYRLNTNLKKIHAVLQTHLIFVCNFNKLIETKGAFKLLSAVYWGPSIKQFLQLASEEVAHAGSLSFFHTQIQLLAID